MRTSWRWVLSACLVLSLMGSTCPQKIVDPDGMRGQAAELNKNGFAEDQLDCRNGDCQDWYRVRVDREGLLMITGRLTQSASSDGGDAITVNLEDGFGDSIESLPVSGESGQSLSRKLSPGVYLVSVSSDQKTSLTPYEISTRFESRTRAAPTRRPRPQVKKPVAPPPPPEPTYRRVDSEVLEVEGQMARPTGVLLELGRKNGVYSGLKGELFEGDSKVGEIVIVDIYEEGSRGKLTAPLLRPITPSIRAVLLFPDSE